jgi:hypothetical protein
MTKHIDKRLCRAQPNRKGVAHSKKLKTGFSIPPEKLWTADLEPLQLTQDCKRQPLLGV